MIESKKIVVTVEPDDCAKGNLVPSGAAITERSQLLGQQALTFFSLLKYHTNVINNQ